MIYHIHTIELRDFNMVSTSLILPSSNDNSTRSVSTILDSISFSSALCLNNSSKSRFRSYKYEKKKSSICDQK